MIESTVGISIAVAITTFLLLFHPRRSLFILRNPEYAMQFTEKTTGDFIRHRGNAWTSIIYLLIGFSLLTTDGTGQRPLTRSLLGTMNIEFATFSFLYHATEDQWVGVLDAIWLQNLCAASLFMLVGLSDLTVVVLTLIFLCFEVTNLFTKHRQYPIMCFGEKYMIHVLTPLVLLILTAVAILHHDWVDFWYFSTAFSIKAIDRNLARLCRGFRTTSPIQGTSMFHLLTGIVMFRHYAKFT